MIVSLIVIFFIVKAKRDQRLGNQFFIAMIIFWTAVFVIALKPDILEPVLNTTGLVNRSQFLLSASILIILYLLYRESHHSKSVSLSFNQAIRKIALDYFRRELYEEKTNSTEVVIVIVAKNESKNLPKVIDDIHSLKLSFPYKILVVNDGSTDETEKIARQKKVLVVNHYYNIGIGGATKTGYLACCFLNPKIVINIDADGQHIPKYIPEMIEKIKEGADMVYASRFSKESAYKTNTVRLAGNKFYTKLVNRLTKISITDVTSGYRATRFSKIKSIYFVSETNFAIEIGLRAGKNNLKVTEIPTRAETREYGQSQFHRIEKFFIYNVNAFKQIFYAYFKKPQMDDQIQFQ